MSHSLPNGGPHEIVNLDDVQSKIAFVTFRLPNFASVP